uniref:Uncharacterized protein n=1 Tax=Cannabis sativa TaxID=3483 RepID=A0A803PDE9_CANSA
MSMSTSANSVSFFGIGIGIGSIPRLPSITKPHSLVVVSKAKTRQEDRIARHARIRKKIVFGTVHLVLLGSSRKVGEVIAKNCLEKGITKVAFDEGGHHTMRVMKPCLILA